MEQKIALVTGAGRGIGYRIAVQLAKAGYDIAINYVDSKEGAEKTADEVRAMGRRAVIYKADIQKPEAISEMFHQFSLDFDHIDLLVNNAGITRFYRFLEATSEQWDEVMNTDLKGTFFCAQAAARLMVNKGKGGVIINISSNQSLGCWPYASIYGTAKAAVEKLTKNLAMELSKYKIRVVAIAPGYTGDNKDNIDNPRLNEHYNRIVSKIPLKRFAERDEIGHAVVFLASDSAGYITGTTLRIDGGAVLPVLAENDLD